MWELRSFENQFENWNGKIFCWKKYFYVVRKKIRVLKFLEEKVFEHEVQIFGQPREKNFQQTLVGTMWLYWIC